MDNMLEQPMAFKISLSKMSEFRELYQHMRSTNLRELQDAVTHPEGYSHALGWELKQRLKAIKFAFDREEELRRYFREKIAFWVSTCSLYSLCHSFVSNGLDMSPEIMLWFLVSHKMRDMYFPEYPLAAPRSQTHLLYKIFLPCGLSEMDPVSHASLASSNPRCDVKTVRIMYDIAPLRTDARKASVAKFSNHDHEGFIDMMLDVYSMLFLLNPDRRGDRCIKNVFTKMALTLKYD